MKFAGIVTPNGLSFVYKGSPRTVAKDHQNYDAILKAYNEGDVETLEVLCNIVKFVAKVTNGDVKISDDSVYWRGTKVNAFLATRIIELLRDKLSIDSISRFTEKLMTNPTVDVRDDLYKWLENGNMPIFDDGDFLAYKYVGKGYLSVHSGPSGKVYQGVGEVVTLPREECNANRDITCSTGLHFCSLDYLPKFASNLNDGHVIIVKINPADVVAIPTDYNLTKGRTCRFEVIGEVSADEVSTKFANTKVVDSFGTYNAETEGFIAEGEDENYSWDDSWSEEITFVPGSSPTSNDYVVLYEEHGSYAKAAAAIGVARSTFKKRYDAQIEEASKPVLKQEYFGEKNWSSQDILDRVAAWETKTAAAEALGVSTSTLARWLKKING